MIEPDRDHFLYAARRLAAKDRNGLADPEDIAIELGIGLYEVTELVRRYQDSFDWASVPIGKLRTGDPSPRSFASYAAWRAITGNLLIASNFFDIGTCSYLRPMPGVL